MAASLTKRRKRIDFYVFAKALIANADKDADAMHQALASVGLDQAAQPAAAE